MNILHQQYPLVSSRKILKKVLRTLPMAIIIGISVGFTIVCIKKMNHTVNFHSPMDVFKACVFWGFIFVSLFEFFYILYLKQYIKTYFYASDEHFITIRKGVFMPAEIHVQYKKIQDVYVDQDILDRILGIYDVHIASATSTSEIEAHIDGVDRHSADSLKDLFLNKIRQGDTQPTQLKKNVVSETQSKSRCMPESIKEMTEKTYQIQRNWWKVNVIGTLLVSLVVVLSTYYFFFISHGKHGGTTMADDFGVSFTQSIPWGISLFIISFIVGIARLYLWKKNFQFSFNDENIFLRKGVIALEEKYMPYTSIQDVNLKQGILDRMFGIYNVVIENAASGPLIQKAWGKKKEYKDNSVELPGMTKEHANHIIKVVKDIILVKSDRSMV